MMKTSISHLPANKQKEILEILEIIKEEANPEKVILFGSHATGNWVEDEYVEDGLRYSYNSDYDFMVVINKDGEKEHEIVSHIENRCLEYENTVSVIVHDINYVNTGLLRGQYFFRDIVKDGILLFDTKNFDFLEPKKLTLSEEQEIAAEYYKKWHESGTRFLKYTILAMNDALAINAPLNEVAFLLHQTAERFYGVILLVFTGYKPKTHHLEKYRKYAKHISEELYTLFLTPSNDPVEYRLFDLLKRGYLDARYKDDYVITAEDLSILINRVTEMQEITRRLCLERINSLFSQ